MRETCDNVFNFFKYSPNRTLSAFRATNISNERMLDMPRAAHLPKLAPFRYGENDKQAGISAAIRREYSPLAWVAVMGLTNVSPDEDELLRSCLLVDR